MDRQADSTMTPAARVEAWNRRHKDGDTMILNDEHVIIRDWAFLDAEDSVVILIERPCGCKYIMPIDELEPTPETKVKAWNREHPVGTAVKLRDIDETFHATSEAFTTDKQLGGAAVIFISGNKRFPEWLNDISPVQEV